MKVYFLNFLDTREIAEGAHMLLAPFACRVHDGAQEYIVTVDEGFITDFASVPRIPFAYLLFGGIGNMPAVIHDGGYSGAKLVTVRRLSDYHFVDMPREWWDEVFKAGLEARGISWFARNMMYAGVRVQGHNFFRINSKT